MRFQARDPRREKLAAGVKHQIKNKIRSLALRHDCSMSFVTNTLLAQVLNVPIHEAYNEPSDVTRKFKNGKR